VSSTVGSFPRSANQRAPQHIGFLTSASRSRRGAQVSSPGFADRIQNSNLRADARRPAECNPRKRARSARHLRAGHAWCAGELTRLCRQSPGPVASLASLRRKLQPRDQVLADPHECHRHRARLSALQGYGGITGAPDLLKLAAQKRRSILRVARVEQDLPHPQLVRGTCGMSVTSGGLRAGLPSQRAFRCSTHCSLRVLTGITAARGSAAAGL
jgi:hypothetical protein